jgi:transcriptional regulator with XRE-family HTH domain
MDAMTDGGRNNVDIAKRLVALRTSLGLNQVAFAALVEISQPAMNNYERGIRRPDLDVAVRIHQRTGITLDWLYLGNRSGLPGHLLAKLPDLSESKRAG